MKGESNFSSFYLHIKNIMFIFAVDLITIKNYYNYGKLCFRGCI